MCAPFNSLLTDDSFQTEATENGDSCGGKCTQMVRDLCSSSSDCGSEFSGAFILLGISWGLFFVLTKEKWCAKNMSIIFYESAADFPLGFSLW